MIGLRVPPRRGAENNKIKPLRVSNCRYNIPLVADVHTSDDLDERMNSMRAKKVLKVAAAAAGFVVVLFAPTGCLVTTATTGGTTSGGLGDLPIVGGLLG